MINKPKNKYFVKKQDLSEEAKIIEQENNFTIEVQEVTETRIRRDNMSIYVNAPSREIRKWFESRKI